MESSTHNHNYNHQNGQPGSGLPRFRSAPISLLADANQHDAVLGFQEFEDKSAVARLKESTAVNYGSLGLPPHYPRQNNSGASCSAMDSSSYAGLFGSAANSSLSRQSSSPAGLFGSHHLGVQNGYVIMKGAGNYAGVNGTNEEVSLRLKSQLSFSSRVPSSFGKLSQISEVGTESTEAAGANDDGRFFSTSGVPYSSWNGTNFSENFNSMKRDQQNNGKLFSGSQDGEIGDRMHLLSHHLSLPKTSAEMVAMEKFLHFQDSVPCKIRAKRGCATHPRSIAERVRRTRISERMRKLQELVPNMDKQTNTADMLDLAADYIKNLQRQYKTLSENRANCKCLSRPVQNQLV